MTNPNEPREQQAQRPQSGWDAPVVYLDAYPAVDIGPRGFPYYVCASCTGPLQVLPRSSAAGVMLVCVYNCGQRYWIDDDR
jgi:hypothetical protein